LDIGIANDSNANANPTDWQSYKCRASRSIAVCSNTAKIKSPSYKYLFIPKLLKSIRHFEKMKDGCLDHRKAILHHNVDYDYEVSKNLCH